MENYFLGIETQYKTGHAKEHAYRPDLKTLFESLLEGVTATNDPKRSEHGAPDFVFTKGEMIYGYAEAKDIDVDLSAIIKSEQLKRYFGYSNLILTNYIDFRFYRNGVEWCDPISIAHFNNGSLVANPENYDVLSRSIKDFYTQAPERIKSGPRLTKIMGGRARRIRDNVSKYLEEENDKNLDLIKIYEVIKKNLIHDITHVQFADMYAQTLVYGLFVARYHDTSLNTFSRQEARDLIPASNPFLQHFFDHLAGSTFDKRLRYIVDELCEIFAVSEVKELMNDYKKDRDPVIHFYEDFLFEYDNDLRKKMGVFYTPAPVVSFIVRTVDEILKKDFNLVNGLADTSKVSVDQTIQGKKKKVEVHRVQVLDPATGTGTFLNEVIKYIHSTSFPYEKGLWNSYVNKDLLPRLHGFELMMASYTIAHLKLAMTLRDTGVDEFTHRLGVYLTNSLEEAKVVPDDLFGSFGLMDTITKESSEASRIKSEYPVMVVVGNPPYSISSLNKGKWIQELTKVYKIGLENERNLNALSDDYVKFIRFSEHFIERNKSGVVAMITNNSFIDGITYRQMRKHLLEIFDDIYVLDLHGNSKKKEQDPNGGKDENVFNIQQGVSISLFVRKKTLKNGFGKVYHSELFGKQEDKFKALDESTLSSIKWRALKYSKPYYFFVPKDFSSEGEYYDGFKLDDLFIKFASGIKFRKDNLLVRKHFDKKSVELLLEEINTFESKFLYKKYDFNDTSDWKLENKGKLFIAEDFENIKPVLYRPFDTRYTYYPLNDIAEIIPRGDSRKSLMKNMLKDNTALLSGRQAKSDHISQFFITNSLSEMKTAESTTGSHHFPLYLYSDDGLKKPNLHKEIWSKINETAGETTPENILDYIYAVLHSPKYREVNKEFLKIDFPRVPYPKNKEEFWNLVSLGTKLREFHLLEAPELQSFNLGITFVGEGDAVVEKPLWSSEGRVHINKEQFFDGVSREVFDFYIGGYQPAQKWLKDRKGRTLTAEDIVHYKKICVSIKRTIEIMKDVDTIIKI